MTNHQTTPDPAALKKLFSESVSRTGRFIVSTMIILFVLTVVVEQQIREYDTKTRDLRRNKAAAAALLETSQFQLARQYSVIRDYLNASEDVGIKSNTLPKPNLPPDKLGETQQKLTGFIDSIRALLTVESQKKKPLDRYHIRPNERDENRIERLSQARKLIETYQESFQSIVVQKQMQAAADKEIKTLKTTKKSIPTFFGNFEVIPRLGLLGLAFATLLVFLWTQLSILRIRALANRYNLITNGKEQVSDEVPEQFWLYNVGLETSRILPQGPKPLRQILLAGLFHATWLIWSGWLVWECWVKWNSSEGLLFDFKEIWNYLLAILFTACVAVSVWQFFPRTWYQPFLSLKRRRIQSKRDDRSVIVPRRAFLLISALVVGATATVFIFRARRFKHLKVGPLTGSDVLTSENERVWVANERSHVLHHREVCFHSSSKRRRNADLRLALDHLPKSNLQFAFNEVPLNYHVHTAYQTLALEELASAARRRRENEQAIRYLKIAISLSPFSYHLYDRLVGIYGLLRRYDEIRSLVDDKLKAIDEQLKPFQTGKNKEISMGHLSKLQKTRVIQLIRAREAFLAREVGINNRSGKSVGTQPLGPTALVYSFSSALP